MIRENGRTLLREVLSCPLVFTPEGTGSRPAAILRRRARAVTRRVTVPIQGIVSMMNIA